MRFIQDEDLVPPNSKEGFRVLLASDLHIGHQEKDEIRKGDTIKAFEEVLTIAKERAVDLILLGGDLFDKNKPSGPVQLEVVQLLRKFCFGDEPIQFSFLSDPARIFSNLRFQNVNYEDGNLNVGLPVFSIHGNHDDLTGNGYCALDPLHEAGLLNFIGKHIEGEDEQIKIQPVFLEKGATKLAIFGLGSQKDERLQRAFRDERVHFQRPQEDLDSWFNLFVLHQTRTDYGRNNRYISESYIPSFIDLTLWGHEHEARIEPEEQPQDERDCPAYIIQPGSTVATSLDPKEAGDRFVALLEVKGQDFKSTPIPLRTTRQFLFGDQITLSEVKALHRTALSRDLEEKYMEHCAKKVEELLKKAEKERRASYRPGAFNRPELPLIRIRVDHAGCERFNVSRFGQQFVGRAANSSSILMFMKEKNERMKAPEVDHRTMDEVVREHAKEQQSCVGDMIQSYFSHLDAEKRPMLLSELAFNESVKSFVEGGEVDFLKQVVDHQLDRTTELIVENQPEDEPDDLIGDITGAMKLLRTKRLQRIEEFGETSVAKEERSALSDLINQSVASTSFHNDEEGDDDDDDVSIVNGEAEMMDVSGTSVSRGNRGSRARGRATTRGRGGRGRGRGAAAAASQSTMSSFLDTSTSSRRAPKRSTAETASSLDETENKIDIALFAKPSQSVKAPRKRTR